MADLFKDAPPYVPRTLSYDNEVLETLFRPNKAKFTVDNNDYSPQGDIEDPVLISYHQLKNKYWELCEMLDSLSENLKIPDTTFQELAEKGVPLEFIRIMCHKTHEFQTSINNVFYCIDDRSRRSSASNSDPSVPNQGMEGFELLSSAAVQAQSNVISTSPETDPQVVLSIPASSSTSSTLSNSRSHSVGSDASFKPSRKTRGKKKKQAVPTSYAEQSTVPTPQEYGHIEGLGPISGRICVECLRDDTPEWRKGPEGPRSLCNACGLYYGKQLKKVNLDVALQRLIARRPEARRKAAAAKSSKVAKLNPEESAKL